MSEQDEAIYLLFQKKLKENKKSNCDVIDYSYVVSWHLRGQFTTRQINYSLDKRVKSGELVKRTSRCRTMYALAEDKPEWNAVKSK